MAVAICKCCGSAILEGEGAVVITVQAPGQPGRQTPACKDCAEQILSRLQRRPVALGSAVAE